MPTSRKSPRRAARKRRPVKRAGRPTPLDSDDVRHEPKETSPGSRSRGTARTDDAPARTRAPARHPAGVPAKLPGDELAQLPLDLLQRGKYQPRVDMRQEALQELADSIKAQGVVQPIVVRPLGQRRARANAALRDHRRRTPLARRADRGADDHSCGHPPRARRSGDRDGADREHPAREPQSARRSARARAADQRVRLTHQQAADAVGRSRAAVTNLLRLLELAPEVCELVEKRELEMGHARALLGLTHRRQQVEVGALVAKKGFRCAIPRRWCGAAEPAAGGGKQRSRGGDPNVRAWNRSWRRSSGARCDPAQHSGKGKLVVTYNSLDELDGILAHIQ